MRGFSYLCLILLLTAASPLLAYGSARIHTASGAYTYYAPSDVSLDQAKQIALDRAKIQIIADEFGTFIMSSGTTTVENGSDSDSKIAFYAISESEVKGEWLETIGEPEYSITYQNDMLLITVKVTGRIREIKESKAEFEAKVLRNGTSDEDEDDTFVDGNQIYLSFLSASNGYLAVYLYDGDGIVSRMLPYSSEQQSATAIKKDFKYIFFSKDNSYEDISSDVIDEYVLHCEKQKELNRLYVIFSPNRFNKALDYNAGELLPRQLHFDNFKKWISMCRRADNQMTVIEKDLTITENKY